MQTISIIGFGRFGKVLAKLLQQNFQIQVYDPNINNVNDHNIKTTDLKTACEAATIFIAVPIRVFEKVIQEIIPFLKTPATIIDVCSVKVYPVNILQKYLPKNMDIIATHPLFGPDSFDEQGNLKIVCHKVRDQHKQYQQWLNFFKQQHLTVLEMSPEEHDHQAAHTQGITHFIGRTLAATHAKPTSIDTLGYQKLLAVMQQTCNDTWELFVDLQQYNPYTNKVVNSFIESAISLQKTVIKKP